MTVFVFQLSEQLVKDRRERAVIGRQLGVCRKVVELIKEERLDCLEELVNVGELQDLLVDNLSSHRNERNRRMRRGSRTYDKDEVDLVGKGPFQGVAVFVVGVAAAALFNEDVSDEAVDRRAVQGRVRFLPEDKAALG